MAATSSLALSLLFVLCLLYKYGALTQLDSLQEIMSLELRDDYVVSHVAFSGMLWLTCMSTFALLGVIVAKQAGDEAIHRARVRRLLYLQSSEEVPTPHVVRSATRLQEMINGPALYKKDARGRIVEDAAPFPTAGPFHVFLSHSELRCEWNLLLLHSRTSLCANSKLTPHDPHQIGSTGKRRCA